MIALASAGWKARNYTLTPAARRLALVNALARLDAERIEGDVVECGVWRGGNIILARKVSPARACWLYDTFTGMTEPGPDDTSRTGGSAMERFQARRDKGESWCAASLDEVKECLRETGVYDEAMLRFVKGDVLETLRAPANLPERIALLRLDTDWYASTRAELDVLYPRLAPGGSLIVDDYGHWMGSRKAVDEYFAGQGIEFEQVDYSCVQMVKPWR